jgi:phosphoribosyl 1,2-cyclic phosphodiesterase
MGGPVWYNFRQPQEEFLNQKDPRGLSPFDLRQAEAKAGRESGPEGQQMLIRCYGARGSIPVSGPEYDRYGGDTTCLEVRSRNDEVIVIDAGSGIRRLGNRLLAEGRRDFQFIFTHSHWDHILGFPFFKPLYDPRTTIHITGCPTAQGNIRTLISRTMDFPFYPVPFDRLTSRVEYSGECALAFRIDTIDISYIPLCHPNLGQGYRLEEAGKSFVFLTDNELSYPHRGGRSFEEYAAFARGADLLVHDAEYTPEEYEHRRGWGHSHYVEALELANRGRGKRFRPVSPQPGPV